MIEDKIKNYITAQLRRIFKWSKQYKNCKERSLIKGNLFRCEGCKELIDKKGLEGIHKYEGEMVWAENMHVDHVAPVVPVEGYKDNNEWAKEIINRMINPNEGFMNLCESCHYIKTAMETEDRWFFRRLIK